METERIVVITVCAVALAIVYIQIILLKGKSKRLKRRLREEKIESLFRLHIMKNGINNRK
jgi:hypothetical protein